MDSLPSSSLFSPPSQCPPMDSGGPIPIPAASHIPKSKPISSQGTGLSSRRASACLTHKFDTPEAYEAIAKANMRAFLEKNAQRPSSSPPTAGWLTSEQVHTLSQSQEGRALLLLISDIHQFSEICVEKKGGEAVYQLFKTDDLPFIFSAEPDKLLKNVRTFFKNVAIMTLDRSPYCFGNMLDTTMNPNLSDIDVINHERLLVKALSLLEENKKNITLHPQALLADFIRTIECGVGSHALLHLHPQAFEHWLDMQSTLGKLLIDNFYRKKNTELFKCVDDFIWSLLDHSCVSAEQVTKNQALTLDYMASYLIPRQLLPLLFHNPITGDTAKSGSSGQVLPTPCFPEKMVSNLLTFGEEFEFFNEEGKVFDEQTMAETLSRWQHLLQQTLTERGITDYAFSTSYRQGQRLDVRIGNWHCLVYDDFDIIEVNTSPYQMEQLFTVQNTSMTAYKLFDLFILDIAKALHLPTRSGHKHIGIARAFNGNAEILLRLLFDVEKRGWFPRLLLREQRSKDQYCYLSQSYWAEHFTLNSLIDGFNRQLQTAPGRKNNKGFRPVKQLADIMDIMGLWGGKSIPLNLLHLEEDTQQEDSGEVREALNTIEFRFLQAARSGKEAKLINRLLVGWLELMEKHQHSNTPLSLELDNPMNYAEGRDEEVTALFRAFVEELELNWDTFKSCSFLQSSASD